MTQAWFDTAKVNALYNKDQMPLNVWRGGTITEVSEEHQQTEMDKTGKGKGDPKWWDSPANTQPKMQVYVTVQTTERNPADPDDTGLRRIYIRKDGHAPGSVFTETGKALKEAGVRTGLEIGGEFYLMLTGSTPAKNPNFEDRKLWKVAYRPPANQFFATEVLAAPAPQASSNGQPTQQPAAVVQSAPQQFPSYAGAPAASNHPQWGPSGGPQEQYAPAAVAQQAPQQYVPVAQPQPVTAAVQQLWEQPAAPQQAPQWPSAPPQSQPPIAAPPAQQPVAQGQQWPPGGQQTYQPPPVDPRNPFG